MCSSRPEHGKFSTLDPQSVYALQVEDVCKTLASFPELKDGYNAVGFSQGAAAS